MPDKVQRLTQLLYRPLGLIIIETRKVIGSNAAKDADGR